MIKVITYGTYDLLHYGHIRLLERAKALGDYLIVGVTSDAFDRARGKINVQQSFNERFEAIKSTGIADEIIVEEYEGQKIDDICKYGVDIFTVGSDWIGQFDYLNKYCKVVYLSRTEGISSTDLRSEDHRVKLGLLGDSLFLNKVEKESHYVNGIDTVGICTNDVSRFSPDIQQLPTITKEYDQLLEVVDAVFIKASPVHHYDLVKKALEAKKHVLCESPISLSKEEWVDLFDIAKKSDLILFNGLKTAYATAYSRLLLLIKSDRIGSVVSVDATCTSLGKGVDDNWDPIFEWGPTALLPVFQILGTDYIDKNTCVRFSDETQTHDVFSKIDYIYPHAVASIKIGNGVKSEGELIISGTKGYIYVPAPWWKTDYFEMRFENATENRRFFYQLEGEGMRYELLHFLQSTKRKTIPGIIEGRVTRAICEEVGAFYKRKDIQVI